MTARAFPDLIKLQNLISDLIRAPEGVASGVAALVDSGDLESQSLAFMIEPDDRMSATERLDVYANMYFYRLHDCLAEEFPKTLAHIGPEHFNNLVTDYLLAHPPSHFSLNEVGRALPGFVAGHSLAQDFVALSGLAELEWARSAVFDEADAAAISRDVLVLESAESPSQFFLRVIPAIRVLYIDERALSLWEAPEGGEAPSTTVPINRKVVVWRKNFVVNHRPAVPDEGHCLETLMVRDLSLADLGELLLAHDRSAEESAERFAALLELWLANGLLTNVHA
jgi:hypothetical protein